MLRELHQLLDELHDGLNAIELHGGVRLANVDMTLPLELRPVFRDGGCVLLADVPRQRGVGAWAASPTRLVIGWSSDGADDAHSSAGQEAREPALDRHPGAGGDPRAWAFTPNPVSRKEIASDSAFARHPRAGGDPVAFACSSDADASMRKAGSLGPRLRGDDEASATSMTSRVCGDDMRQATSMDPRLRGDDGLKGHRVNDTRPAVMHVERPR